MSERLDRDTYLDERRALSDAEAEQSWLFDRAILVLSGGALGLSLTFIREVVPQVGANTVGWLVGGWSLLIASLMATLISFQVSQLAFRRQRDVIEHLYGHKADEEADAEKTENTPASWTNRLNIASLGLFIMGTIALTVFVAINFLDGGLDP